MGGTPVKQCWMGGGHTSEAVLDGGWGVGDTPVRQCLVGVRGAHQ